MGTVGNVWDLQLKCINGNERRFCPSWRNLPLATVGPKELTITPRVRTMRILLAYGRVGFGLGCFGCNKLLRIVFCCFCMELRIQNSMKSDCNLSVDQFGVETKWAFSTLHHLNFNTCPK